MAQVILSVHVRIHNIKNMTIRSTAGFMCSNSWLYYNGVMLDFFAQGPSIRADLHQKDHSCFIRYMHIPRTIQTLRARHHTGINMNTIF